jgi:hypothetical protein
MFKKFKTFIKENKKLDEFFYEKQITMFFEYKNKLYGAKEQDRIIFAKMKSNLKIKKNYLEYKKENFYGYPIEDLLKGEDKKKEFYKKDLKEIKVLQIEKVKEKLKDG